MASKNEVATTAVQGEIIHPWMTGYKLDQVDKATLAKSIDKYTEGDKIVAAAHKMMAENTAVVVNLQAVRLTLQGLAFKHIAVTGKLTLAEEVSNWLGLDNRANRFKQALLDHGPVAWDDAANEGDGGFVIDKAKQREAQKAIAKGDGSYVAGIVEKLQARGGEGRFRPLNLKNDLARIGKTYANAIPKAKERKEAAKAKGAKELDDFTGHEIFFDALRKIGVATA